MYQKQINALDASVKSLENVSAEIEATVAALDIYDNIETLKQMDFEIEGRIYSLKTLLETEDRSTNAWKETTLVTIEQYSSIVECLNRLVILLGTELADVDETVIEHSVALTSKISAFHSSVTTWVAAAVENNSADNGLQAVASGIENELSSLSAAIADLELSINTLENRLASMNWKFFITFSTPDCLIGAGQTQVMEYSISGADDNTIVWAVAENGWLVDITSPVNGRGTISVTAPDFMVVEDILIFAYDIARNATIMNSLNLVSGKIMPSVSVKYLNNDACVFNINVTANVDYEVQIPDDADSWLSVVGTKAVRTDVITFSCSVNNTGQERSAYVKLIGESGVEAVQFSVIQSDFVPLCVNYAGNDNVSGLSVKIGKWTEEQNISNYTAVEGGEGCFEGNTIVFNPSVLSTLNAGDKIWICIDKVVKYFHTLTAEEVAAATINLPDKDGGCTLLPEPTLGGKPYINDWVVALYMGVNGYINSQPIYWATGNLIAVKTGGVGESSDPVFYLATLEENAEQAKGAVDGGNPYNANLDGTEESFSKTDGYINCPKGYRWDCFLPLDGTGVRTDGFVAEAGGEQWNADFSALHNNNTSFVGIIGYDIVATQLKGYWRLPYNFDLPVPGGYDGYSPNIDCGDLVALFFSSDGRISQLKKKGMSVYWEVSWTSAAGTNTLLFPAAGMRRVAYMPVKFYSQGVNVIAMAGNVSPFGGCMAFMSYAVEGHVPGYYMNNTSQFYLLPIRPATE